MISLFEKTTPTQRQPDPMLRQPDPMMTIQPSFYFLENTTFQCRQTGRLSIKYILLKLVFGAGDHS